MKSWMAHELKQRTLRVLLNLSTCLGITWTSLKPLRAAFQLTLLSLRWQTQSWLENKAPLKNTTFFTLPTWKGPELQQLNHNMDVRRKTQKRHLWHNIKRGHFPTFWRGWSQRWPLCSAAIGVVSVENSLCSIILMAVSNCIMPEQQVALAAGVAALTASPHWPRGSGQGYRVRALSGHRPGFWPMGRAGQQWGAVVVGRMIYRRSGRREC